MPKTRLIVVCCHGIWLGGASRGAEESEWLIADFQRGETPTFIEHIKAGVQCLAQDREGTVLMFSGGPTRPETRISEAQSYANIAGQHHYWQLLPTRPTQDDVLAEERALDSYHNILFSLTLFYARFGTWPQHLTVVSHGFKRERLIDGHCAAIGFPLEHTSFVGIDPPGMASSSDPSGAAGDKVDAMKGVGQAMGQWRSDPHGRGQSLAGKRAKRNPWEVSQSVFYDGRNDSHGGLAVKVVQGQDVLNEDTPRPW